MLIIALSTGCYKGVCAVVIAHGRQRLWDCCQPFPICNVSTKVDGPELHYKTQPPMYECPGKA